MSLAKKLAQKAGTVNTDDLDDIKPTDQYQARTAPGQLMGLQGRVLALEKALEEARKNSPTTELLLSELHEVAGRRRRLSEEEFAELRENLRHNVLITPITVRPRAEGGYEIVSGHNRVTAYRELGHRSIPAVVRTLDDERAITGAFYANLLQQTLPDYEKYLGFTAIRKLDPSASVEDIAKSSGLSERHISRLLAFANLPQEALNLLAEKPGLLGATAAEDLAKFAQAGRADQVVEAIKRLAENKVTQDEAVRLVANSIKTPSQEAPQKPQPIPVKWGKEKYLTIRPTGVPTSYKLDFADAGEARETMEAFQAWIKARLIEKKRQTD